MSTTNHKHSWLILSVH